MKVVAILQARLHSTRLPNKMLLPLAGAPLVQRVIERVQRAKMLDDIVLAVPAEDARIFAPIAKGRCQLFAYVGDEADLVGRYLACAWQFGAETIVRIPCDNPCIDPTYIDAAVQEYLFRPYVFYSNTTTLVRGSRYNLHVDGVGAEVFSYSRLQWLDQKTQCLDPSYREHPHKYFNFELPIANIRMDVNTQEDYDKIAALYDHYLANFSAKQAVNYFLEKEASYAQSV